LIKAGGKERADLCHAGGLAERPRGGKWNLNVLASMCPQPDIG
jgi:hypothetical protein